MTAAQADWVARRRDRLAPVPDAVPDAVHDDAAEPVRPFAALGYLFTPADRSASWAIVEAPAEWRTAGPEDLPDVDHVVWGRLPKPGAVEASLVAAALRRERAIRRVENAVVHRLPPPHRGGLIADPIRSLLLGGAVVEITRARDAERIVDAVLHDAGAVAATAATTLASAAAAATTLASAATAATNRDGPARPGFRASGDGSALWHVSVDGEPAELRLARSGGLKDPLRNAAALDALAAAGIPSVPRLVGREHGRVGEAVWTTESRLPGRPARALDRVLREETLALFARLPLSTTAVSAPDARAEAIAHALPDHGATLRRLVGRTLRRAGTIPSILQHGDLWLGNLLVDEAEHLTGVIDWDNWHAAGVPGSDALHLYAMELRRKEKLDLGDLWATRFWADERFRTWAATYWRALGLEPRPALLDAAAVDWWTGQVAASLRRGRQPARDPKWVERNVARVLMTAWWS